MMNRQIRVEKNIGTPTVKSDATCGAIEIHPFETWNSSAFLPIRSVPSFTQCYVILQQKLNCLSVKTL